MKYIVAVSGGVDSMVMLDMLVRSRQHELIVAHVDHGIRDDSRADAQLVQEYAARHGLVYESVRFELGRNVSEDEARRVRYAWLEQQRRLHKAHAIATAHHEDDVIETMMINLVRGTGWRGLCPLRTTTHRVRPLITLSKAAIVAYAIDHHLTWHEDSTNDDARYLRNYLRHTVVRRLTVEERHRWLALYEDQRRLASAIDGECRNVLPVFLEGDGLSRYCLIMSGYEVAAEVISQWQQRRFERKSLRRLWHFAATARPGKRLIEDGVCFRTTARRLIV